MMAVDYSEYEHGDRLFHPSTGTGRRDDPLIPEEQRKQIIKDTYRIPDRSESGWTDAGLVEGIHRSNLTTHMLTGQDPSLGEARMADPNAKQLRKFNAKPVHPTVAWDEKRRAQGDQPGAGWFSANHGDETPDEVFLGDRENRHRRATIVHELGHAYHLRGSRDMNPGNPDPVLEGVADGFADAWADRDPGEPAPPDDDMAARAEAMRLGRPKENYLPPEPHQGSGYGSRRVSSNGVQTAAYLSARQFTSTTGMPPTPNVRNEAYSDMSPLFYSDNRDERDLVENVPTPDDVKLSVAVGKFATENPEVMGLFQAIGPDAHPDLVKARNAASMGVARYKRTRDLAQDHKELNPRAGDARVPAPDDWRISKGQIDAKNDAVQSRTLPLVDPETGEQYDNTEHYDDPLFPRGHPLPPV